MKTRLPRLFLGLLGAAALCATSTSAGTFKRITIDGSFEDWAGVPPAVVDAEDAPGQFDLKEVYVANDDQYLYVRIKIHAEADYGAFHHHVLIDADASTATGHPRLNVGSELMIEDGAAYQQKNGGFNEGNASALDWAAAPAGQVTEFEARISRGVLDAEGLPVMVNDSLALAFEAQNGSWATVDQAPDTEGVFYDMAPTPGKATGSTTLISLSGTDWRYNDSGSSLGTDWLLAEFDDSSWGSGLGAFGFATASGVYPAVQTPLSQGRTTYYLRVPFTWDFDSYGIALAADAYLSDGAVIYLNGAEVKRIRMPAGPVNSSTQATGGPAVPGSAEKLSLPSAPLVVGANVLEVEVHQAAATPAELVFGLQLEASDSLPPSIEDPSQPADRTVVEGSSTSFSAGSILGTVPMSFQWFKDGVAIEGATSATLTIAEVLFGDAGKYHVDISNATGTTISSRAAQLLTTADPVSFPNAGEPADRTIVEGESTTLSVQVAGSPAFTFQWFKNGTAIEGATTAELTLGNAALSDSGDYWLVVSNRVNQVVSRTAKVNVVRDSTGPQVVQVAGSATKVVVEFSEPLDEASANAAASYSLTGGAKVQSASLDTADSRTVTLRTSALTFGQVYTLGASGVKDRFGNASSGQAPFRATILIDGDFGDWTGIDPLATESQDTPEGLEFKDIYVASDDQYLYVRFNFYAEIGQLPVDHYFHIFADADNDIATGMGQAGLGSELMIENSNGYQQKNGQFNEGGITGLDFALAPQSGSADFECRISRNARYETDGERLFNGDTVALALQLISNTWALVDTAPLLGPVVHTFAEMPPMNPGPLRVQASPGGIEISWTGPGTLESKDSLGTAAWTTVPNATSPYQVSPTGQQRFYRLRL